MDFKLNSADKNVGTQVSTAFINKLTETYQKLFEYSVPELTIMEDLPVERLNKLNYAWLNRKMILLTLNDERQIIGKVKKITSGRQVVVSSYDSNVIEILPINTIFKVEFSDR